MTFKEIPISAICRPVSPRPGDEFAWHTKEFWIVNAELKLAYWMDEWEVKGMGK